MQPYWKTLSGCGVGALGAAIIALDTNNRIINILGGTLYGLGATFATCYLLVFVINKE
jgi:hypothetical protein